MKRLNTWLIAAWGLLVGYLQFVPDALTQVWLMMPQDIKDAMPPYFIKAVGYALLAMMMLGKTIMLKRENKRLKDDGAN